MNPSTVASEAWLARLRAVLLEADQSFFANGDVMEALGWVAFAAKTGTPLPPRIGQWLHDALDAYRAGKVATLDAALGLDGIGKSNPRRQLRERSALEGALARMMVLHMIGATISQAAAMVARLTPDFKATTLADRYGRSGLGVAALQGRPQALRRWLPSEIEQVLCEYPDHRIEIEQGKEAIRAMYAKHRL